MNHLQIKKITLEEAKGLIKNYGRPLNGYALVIQDVAPRVASNGLILGDIAQKDAQQKVNQNGVLVVSSPFKREDYYDKQGNLKVVDLPTNVVFEGERILYNPQSLAGFTRTIYTTELLDGLTLTEAQEKKPEHYKAYALICMHPANFACVIKE